MRRFLTSFVHAFRGIGYAFSGRNFQIQAIVAIIVIDIALYVQISKVEWLFVLFAIGLVLSLEATNSALEEVCNKFHPETHPHIALIKDVAAAAVLIASLTALSIGLMIFSPYFF